MLLLPVFTSLQRRRLYTNTGKELFFFSPPLPPLLSEVQCQAFSLHQKDHVVKSLLQRHWPFLLVEKKELLFYGGLEAEEPPAARAATLMVSAISPAPAERLSGQSLCSPSVWNVAGFGSASPLPPAPCSRLALVTQAQHQHKNHYKEPAICLRKTVCRVSLLKNELLLHFSFQLLGKCQDEMSHTADQIWARVFHLLFKTVGTSLVLTPMLNQKEALIFQQMLEN